MKMATTVRLDDNRLLQLIRNTTLWTRFPVFKNLAIKAQSADAQLRSSVTGCPVCAARKRTSGQNGLHKVLQSVKDAIIRMSSEDRALLKKALNADYIKFTTADTQGRPKELMY